MHIFWIYIFIAISFSVQALPKEQWIVAYSRHHATYEDFLFYFNTVIAKSTISKYKLTRERPETFYKPCGLGFKEAEKLLKDPKMEMMFRNWMENASMIIVSDTIPDVIPFLLMKARYQHDPSSVYYKIP